MSEGDSFTRYGVVRHACRHRVTARGVRGGLGDLIRCAGRAQERPFGAVTPLERRDED